MPKTLRERLRADTQDAHTALDQSVSGLDLTTPVGLAQFLEMQVLAMGWLSSCCPGAVTAALMGDLSQRARRDLDVLSTHARRVELPAHRALHPLAVDYVISGSRLGTTVLKTRWQTATDPRVQAAKHYFTAPSSIASWREFSQTANGIPATDPVSGQVVDDTVHIFELYLTCARSVQTAKGLAHV